MTQPRPTDAIVVLMTAPDSAEAARIADHLLDERLVACANVVEGISSHYVWQGRRERASECLVIMKTRRELFPQLREKIRTAHSYEVPEIIALPIVAGDDDYLAWISETTQGRL